MSREGKKKKGKRKKFFKVEIKNYRYLLCGLFRISRIVEGNKFWGLMFEYKDVVDVYIKGIFLVCFMKGLI